ncbi:MAG: prepilin-type N-terminal cleavage/methylation domain-containing protein [Planctomyces sp.]|nr:prepilin-type N-terminal cleavage/methylation domain-containing protein [Planctomyces sp.]
MRLRAKKPSRAGRHGYTLMEMLIAAVLIAALMSVIWGMMSMYNAYLTAGRRQAVERQLVRALFQTVSDDIQNLAVIDSNPKIQLMTESVSELSDANPTFNPDESTSNDSQAMLEESRELRSLEVLRPPANARNISFHGSDSAIRISYIDLQDALSIPDPSALSPDADVDSGELNPEGTTPRVSEFRTIVWYFRSPNALSAEEGSILQQSGLYRIAATTMQYSMARAEESQSDLIEQPSDGSGLNPLELLLQPDLQPNDNSGLGERIDEPVELESIPEVVSCRFEYFSGSAWLDQWNSEASQGLPLAVRMKLRIIDADQVEAIRTLLQGGSNTEISANTVTAPDTAGETSSLGGGAPAIAARSFERTILLQPVRASMPMLEDGGSTGSTDFTTPAFSGGSQP